MEAKALICANNKEIEHAVRLGLKEVPEPKFQPVPFLLHFHLINWSYKHPDGTIRIHVTNQEVMLVYEEHIWARLEGIFGK